MIQLNIKSYLNFGFFCRVVMIYVGNYLDQTMEVKFTDVDYRVFTDASRHVYYSGSPYDRHTYRYTPILAWLLLPNITISPLFGKILFSMFDVMASWLIYHFVKGEKFGEEWATCSSLIYLFNPFVMALSARGNADSIVVVLVLLTLTLYKERVFFLTGIFLGLAIHFKIYPIIFSLPMYLALTDRQGIQGFFHVNAARFRLVAGTILTLALLTGLFYQIYGMEFIEESYLHHITRRDTRHNFSVYFYMLYLTVEEEDIGLNMITFLPQLVLLLTLSVKFSRVRDIPFCVLCQTFVFVIYNKVCTSQYFLWYLAQLSLVLPKLNYSKGEAMVFVFLWGFTQGSWLIPAYFLEFKGYNTFWYIWIESIAFFCANLFILSRCIRKYLEHETRKDQ